MAIKPLRLIYVRDIIKQTYPDNKWLIESLIPTETITIISGAPASFKSWICHHLAVSVAWRQDFLGHFKVPFRYNVLILDKENHERDLKERFVALDMPEDSSIQFSFDEDMLLTDPKAVEELMKKLRENDIGLLIIDSLRRFHRGDENDAGQMSLIFDNLRRITNTGVSVIVIHHNRKEPVGGFSSPNSVRGSSDILAATDCLIALEYIKQDGVIGFTQHKLRQAKQHDDFAAKIITDEETQTKMQFEYVGEYDKNQEKYDSAAKAARGIFTQSEGKPLAFKDISSLLENAYSRAVLNHALGALTGEGYITKTTGKHNAAIYRLAETDEELDFPVEKAVVQED